MSSGGQDVARLLAQLADAKLQVAIVAQERDVRVFLWGTYAR